MTILIRGCAVLLLSLGLALLGLGGSPALAASVLLDAPTSVSRGWNGTVHVTGYNDGPAQELRLEVEPPSGPTTSDVATIDADSDFDLTFDVGPLDQLGDYDLLAETSETFDSAFATISVVEPLRFTRAGVDATTIYPTVRDGFKDTITTSAATSVRSTVVARVRNDRGRTVRVSDTRTVATGQTFRWTWNGKDQDGSVVPVGRYSLELIAVGDTGARVTRTISGLQVLTDTVTRTRSVRIDGDRPTSRSHRKDCRFTRYSYSHELSIDCWNLSGGGHGTAVYRITVPRSARITGWAARGQVGCCSSPGVIQRTAVRQRPRSFAVKVRVTGFRAFTVRRVAVDYRYAQRR